MWKQGFTQLYACLRPHVYLKVNAYQLKTCNIRINNWFSYADSNGTLRGLYVKSLGCAHSKKRVGEIAGRQACVKVYPQWMILKRIFVKNIY